jgi:hypothetical protein
MMEKMLERRRHKRHRIIDSLFVSFRPLFDKIGWVEDISLGGLSFDYLSCDDSLSFSGVDLDIFSNWKAFGLRKVPCRVVHYNIIETFKGICVIETVRYGLAFENLSIQHKRKLEALLEEHSLLVY